MYLVRTVTGASLPQIAVFFCRDHSTVHSNIAKVEAEIADKPDTREKGLMFRKNIPDGTGMLFVFEEDRVLRFWMKNTPSPLSIAYIDWKGEIKDILDMKPFDLSDVCASGYVRYALEVPQGWFGRAGVKVGDKLDLLPLQAR